MLAKSDKRLVFLQYIWNSYKVISGNIKEVL